MEKPVTDIHRFFEGKCTEAEAIRIADHLCAHPEDMDGLFADEWQETEALTESEYESLRKAIDREVMRSRKLIPMRRWLSVAAVLLVVLITAYLLPSHDAAQPKVLTQAGGYPVSSTGNARQWVLRTNLTPKPHAIQLEDGSTVNMQPGAFIRYLPFEESRTRDITLNGQAFFKVAKNAAKPFTVVAGGIATTALGTQFTVREEKNLITVQLYEGKVKIHAKGELQQQWNGEVYLMPGQEFSFNKSTKRYVVRAITRESAPATAITKERKPAMVSAGDWYMFNNQRLQDVFVQLEELYNVHIEYDGRNFRNVYFIGRFEKTDSLEHILENIAVLKKMKVRKKNDGYVITRQ